MKSESAELIAELKAARTAWHKSYGVPVSAEYARFMEAIGAVTDFVEQAPMPSRSKEVGAESKLSRERFAEWWMSDAGTKALKGRSVVSYERNFAHREHECPQCYSLERDVRASVYGWHPCGNKWHTPTSIENALFELAQCPYPLHDHVSKETWEFACKFVAERRQETPK